MRAIVSKDFEGVLKEKLGQIWCVFFFAVWRWKKVANTDEATGPSISCIAQYPLPAFDSNVSHVFRESGQIFFGDRLISKGKSRNGVIENSSGEGCNTSIYRRFPSHSWFKTLLSKVKPGKVLYLVQVEAMTEVSRVPVEAKAWANSFNIKWNSSLCLKNAPNPCTMFGDSGVWDLIWNIPMQILKLMRQRPQLCPCQFHLVVHRDHMVSVALLLHSSSLHVPLLQRIFCFLCCASSSCFEF